MGRAARAKQDRKAPTGAPGDAVVLPADTYERIRSATRAFHRAREAAEVVVAEANLKVLQAQKAMKDALDDAGEAYGFDAQRVFEMDDARHALIPRAMTAAQS